MKAPALVVGASGGLGRGIVQALLDADYPVIAVARDARRLQALKDASARPEAVTVVPGSIADEAAGAALAASLRQLRRPPGCIVVSVMGPRERGRVLDREADFLRRKFDEDVIPHLVAARHLLPLLAEHGRCGPYLMLGGPCADSPWAGYGQLSISAAALRMLAQVLRQEALATSVRVQQLAICSPVRTGAAGACDCPEWPTALQVGRRVVGLIEQPESAEAVVRFDAACGRDSAPVDELLAQIRSGWLQ
ncbi:MAG: SDR family NAD(P)-dependent oxidoreductase [Rehaibacterium terrae]|uniref:SDR family NAD(P)-dependent oxidoreductase n=1 Tax=Rehaibacterium terrae TaxID=1341696 RepID=UPI00391D0C21